MKEATLLSRAAKRGLGSLGKGSEQLAHSTDFLERQFAPDSHTNPKQVPSSGFQQGLRLMHVFLGEVVSPVGRSTG